MSITVDVDNNSVVNNIQSALIRVPCFIVGMTIGQACKEGKSIHSVWLLLLALIGIMFSKVFSFEGGTIWMIIPFFIYLVIILLKWLNSVTLIDKILLFLGGISLESYLINISLNSLLGTIIRDYGNSRLFYGNYFQYSVVIVLGLFAAFYINKLSLIISERLKTQK